MSLLNALGAAFWLAAASPKDASQTQDNGALLRFSGNLLIPDEIYKSILNLPPDTPATLEVALSVERTLTNFLHRTGYELASVRAVVEGKSIAIVIDEGRLDKVIFRGHLTLKTLRFKLGLPIVYGIFNRPALEREMKKLADLFKIEKVWFELVPTRNAQHKGLQLEQFLDAEGSPSVQSQQPFELQIFFDEKEWDTGFGLELRSTYIDGFEVGPIYQGTNALVKGDRWRAAASTGVNARQRIGDDRLYPTFTQASAEAAWFSPTEIFVLRPFVWLQSELVDRQRRDLGLEGYFGSYTEASVGLWGKAHETYELVIGAGLHSREIFALHRAPGVILPPDISSYRRLKGFALLRVNAILETEFRRADRTNAFKFELKQFSPVSKNWLGYGAYRYQFIIPWGWHDLWLKSQGKWLWGQPAFDDEEPVALYLYGLLGADYVHRIGTVSSEFRFSITREVLKLGVFHGLAIFQEPDRTRGGIRIVRVANAFGPGLHVLIESMFQLDMYMAFGFRSDGRFDTALSVLLEKVF